jgi:O-antigen ligase
VTNAAARKKEANRVLSERVPPQVESQPALPLLGERNQQSKTSAGVTLLGIYLLISRILDIAPVGFLHLPMIMLLGLGVIAISVGDWQKAIQSKVTVFYGLFTVWVLVCFPMSSWRGGSVDSVILAVEAFGLYLVMVLLVKTIADWNRAALAFSYAALAAAILSFFFGRSIDGRIALTAGSFGDPNTFALSLILGLPFWWYKASQSKAFGKILCLLATAPILVSFGRAGSRAGLLALVVMVLAVLFLSEIKQKVAIASIALVALAASAVFLPGYIKARFVTIFQQHSSDLDEESRERLKADIDSSGERQKLLEQSVHMTFEHPLFGVGPGVFRQEAWNERKAKQQSAGQMLVSHNTYTQISSELGVPGFLFFMGAALSSLLYSLSDFRRIKKTNPLVSQASLYTFSSLAALGFGIFFLSIGYSFLLTAMFGLAAALHIVHSNTPAAQQSETDPASVAEPGIRTPEMVLAARRRIEPSTSDSIRSESGRRVRFGRYVDRG